MYRENQPIKKPKKKPHRQKQETKKKTELQHLYEKYLRSEQFKEVKTIVHERDGEKCMFCGRTEEECMDNKTHLQVHHRCYAHLGCGGEVEANDCLLVCGICHRGAHYAPSNRGRFIDKSPLLNNLKINRINDNN